MLLTDVRTKEKKPNDSVTHEYFSKVKDKAERRKYGIVRVSYAGLINYLVVAFAITETSDT